MNCPHCNTHIDEHPANRCFDEWIAEKIFHYHRPPALRKEIPHYSTSIAAAWEVVEKLRDSKKFCCLKFSSDWNYVWGISWVYGDDETHEWHGLGYSMQELPPAICRAAIKATQG